jgi:aminoacrylate hydrolase
LIPGLGGDGRFFSGVVERLAPDFRLVVVDHRGAGRSDRPADGYSIPKIAADVAGLLSEAGGPAHIVGHSTGGAIAQELALVHPHIGLSYTISSSWARSDARFQALFTARAELLEAGLAAAYQRLTHVFGYEADYLAAEAERLSAAMEAAPRKLAPLEVTAKRVRMLLDHDRLVDLPGIATPVQVIAADDDILTPLYLSKAIAEAIPGATLVRTPGTHFHPLTAPDRFADAVRAFVLGLPDAR